MPIATYKGYSSIATESIDTTVTGFDCIKHDLLNHFNCRLGERIARPVFGSIIWDLLFDLSHPRVESLIIQDAQRIINEDPRVELIEINPQISFDNHQIDLQMRLRTIPSGEEELFEMTFRSPGVNREI